MARGPAITASNPPVLPPAVPVEFKPAAVKEPDLVAFGEAQKQVELVVDMGRRPADQFVVTLLIVEYEHILGWVLGH